MNPLIEFRSVLAEPMRQFVASKRMQGYDYTDQAVRLTCFDRFLLERAEKDTPPLRLHTLRQYVETTAHLKGLSRSSRLSSLREFSRFLHAQDPQNALLPEEIVPRGAFTTRFFRMAPEEVAALMEASTELRAPEGIRAKTLGFLVGLLYSTGLRIGEARALTLADMDAANATLHVAKGKFGKQRFVPLSPSTLTALEDYLDFRGSHAETAPSAPLLIGARNRALGYGQAFGGFQRLCRHCGLNGPPRPRLHDLRHNYACRRLELWREEGRDVNTMLPVLATAMGHVNIFATQRYLHIEPSQLHQASSRLHHYRQTHSEERS